MSHQGYNFLGLAQKAGQVQSGDTAVEAAVKKGAAKLVLIASDASSGTKKHFINLAKFKNIPWLEGGEKLELGTALGKSPRSIVAVTGEGFARKIYELLSNDEEDF